MEENMKNPETAETEKKELDQEVLDNTEGGALYPDGIGDKCKHPNAVKTGAEREDSRFIFWSQHQYQYYCPDCKKYIWKDEERV